MRRFVSSWWFGVVATLAAMLVWAGLVVIATLNGWTRAPLAAADDTTAFLAAARERIDSARPGNIVLRLIESDAVREDHAQSIGKPVDADSVFQVASLSKWITAVAVMTLVEQGRIELDAPVDRYLTRWHLPPGAFDSNGVTVRRLLSHTAGLTDGLGYGGFAPGETVQSLVESLTHTMDASPGADGRVRVGQPPGAQWQYSGGSFALLSLLIEEVTGLPFESYVRTAVFQPLGMQHSSFDSDTAAAWDLADFYDRDGAPAIHYRFAAPAAAGLYTTVADMTRFLRLFTSADGSSVLSQATLTSMRAPEAHQFGAAIWGLGTFLYAPDNAGSYVIGHDGSNAPAINTAVRINPVNGDAIIVFATGHPLIATELASQWVFWQTGNVDLLDVVMGLQQTIIVLAAGAILIFGIGVLFAWRVRRTRRRTT